MLHTFTSQISPDSATIQLSKPNVLLPNADHPFSLSVKFAYLASLLIDWFAYFLWVFACSVEYLCPKCMRGVNVNVGEV